MSFSMIHDRLENMGCQIKYDDDNVFIKFDEEFIFVIPMEKGEINFKLIYTSKFKESVWDVDADEIQTIIDSGVFLEKINLGKYTKNKKLLTVIRDLCLFVIKRNNDDYAEEDYD